MISTPMRSSFIYTTYTPHPRRGAILPLAACMLVVIFAFVVFTVDVGYVCMTKAEAQNCADACARAAARELLPDASPCAAIELPVSLPIYRPVYHEVETTEAVEAAKQIGRHNPIANQKSPKILDTDIHFSVYGGGIGSNHPHTLSSVDSLFHKLSLFAPRSTFRNRIDVTVRRDQHANDPLCLFFSPIIGHQAAEIRATSSAAVQHGFGAGPHAPLLPFAIDITIWNAIRFTNGEANAVDLTPLGLDLETASPGQLLGESPLPASQQRSLPVDLMGRPIHVVDEVTCDGDRKRVTPGADGIWEVILLADQLNSSSNRSLTGLGRSLNRGQKGNFPAGTVEHIPATIVSLDFRKMPNPEPDPVALRRVLHDGIDRSNIQQTGSTDDGRLWLPFDVHGHFEMPSKIENDLKLLVGHPRILPLFATLPGTFEKATDVLRQRHRFRIIGWAGVVITEVKLSGPIRYLKLQPCVCMSSQIKPATHRNRWRQRQTMSDCVFTMPRLIE